MKKKQMLLGTAIAFGFFSTSLVTVAQAETTDTTSAQATFNLTAPTEGTLNITKSDDLTFGTATLSAATINVQTTADTELTIQELSGTAPGWTLTAQLSEFLAGDKTLSGAQLFYPAVTATTNAPTGSPAASALPTTVATDSGFQGSTSGVRVSAGGSATKIVEAAKGKGYGQWTMPYSGENKVQLNVPSGQLTGNYTATLTYTLGDTPASSAP